MSAANTVVENGGRVVLLDRRVRGGGRRRWSVLGRRKKTDPRRAVATVAKETT